MQTARSGLLNNEVDSMPSGSFDFTFFLSVSFSPARAAVIQLIHATFNVCIFVLLLVVVDLFRNILTEPHSCETRDLRI